MLNMKKMKNTIIITLFTILSSFSHISYAEALKLCGVEWPPFTYSKEQKITKGISYDVYTEAFRRLQMAVELPWKRCLQYVAEGKYDAVIDNAALEPFLYGQFPTAIYPLAIYVRQDFPQETFSWDDLQGKTVGMVLGYDYTERRFR